MRPDLHSLLLPLLFPFAAIIGAPTQPTLSRVPNGGIQPQALTDSQGAVHLLFYQGDPKAGDLFYTWRSSGSSAFTTPLRVNSRAASAIAIGTIRGGQFALGRAGIIHVVWNGNDAAAGHPGSSLFYTRLNPDKKTFEPQRDVITFTGGLDGGGSIAADQQGRVFVAWHGIAREGDSEPQRNVYLARSTNDGQSFETERSISPEPGACGCCGMKIYSGDRQVYVLYRAAQKGSDRHEHLLASDAQGSTFRTVLTHEWNATTCPMSSAWLGPQPGGTTAAWETRGKVWFCRINAEPNKTNNPISPRGSNQKYPVVVTAADGTQLLAWVEGAGWQKGGALCWQQFDSRGQIVEPAGRIEGVPVWSFAAAIVRADHTFELIY